LHYQNSQSGESLAYNFPFDVNIFYRC
jgi:hypothetical protein